jgi:hypothetical protein
MAEPQDTSKVAEAPDLGPDYRLDAKGRQEAEDDRLSLLERIFDPLSRRRREMARPGWRCLEVHSAAEINGVPEDYSRDGEIKARSSVSLIFEGAIADFA